MRYGRKKSQHVCVKMATLLDGKLYVKTFSMLCVDYNGHVVIIVEKANCIYICIMLQMADILICLMNYTLWYQPAGKVEWKWLILTIYAMSNLNWKR